MGAYIAPILSGEKHPLDMREGSTNRLPCVAVSPSRVLTDHRRGRLIFYSDFKPIKDLTQPNII